MRATTHSRKGSRRLLAGALALASAALLGACSSAPSSAGPGTSTSTSSSTSTTTPGATTTTFDQATNARADVTTPSACHRVSTGAWLWNGTVTNRGHVTNTYTIIVDFTDAAATVEDTKVATVRGLAPGRTADWTVSGAAGRAAVTCVIRSARIS